MNNNFFYIILCLVIGMSSLMAQDERGLKPIKSGSVGIKMGPKYNVRAVVVGVSDYLDEQIPDLNYAHIDAMAFAEYLRSPAGGGLQDDEIKSLYNEEATGGNVHKALYWMVQETEENDECIIYFSGHGDVESIYEDEPGHFLVYDSPYNIYQINSLRIDDLNRIIKTLTVQKKAKVRLITDACRAGKLAGSEINGSQATAASINKQFANEIKIMSCQANEYSMESKDFGGGRGVFSYHLIEGLMGLADDDGDRVITLKEIQRYLEDEVHKTLKSARQTPLTIGDRNAKISYVDETTLEALMEDKNMSTEVEEMAFAMEEDMLYKSSDDLLDKFYAALENDQLLEMYSANQEKQVTAEYYYSQIELEPSYESKLPILKGDFIANLQDDAQEAINKYLAIDLEEMKKRWFEGDQQNFDQYASYLKKASELLGETHYLFPQVQAKQIYFEVLDKRLKLQFENANPEAYAILEAEIKEAFVYQSRAPFLNNELGEILRMQAKYEESLIEYDKAIEISPNWALPVNNKSNVYLLMADYASSLTWADNAIKLKEDFISPYYNKGKAFEALGEFEKSKEIFDSLYHYFPDQCIYINDLAYAHQLCKEFELAEEYYVKAMACDEEQFISYFNLSRLYIMQKKYKESLEILYQAKKLGEDGPDLYAQQAINYKQLGRIEDAIQSNLAAIERDSDHVANKNLANLYLQNGYYTEAIQYYDYYVENISSTDRWIYFNLARAYGHLGDDNGFEMNIYKSIEYGFNDKKLMEENDYFPSIKDRPVYKKVLDKLDANH